MGTEEAQPELTFQQVFESFAKFGESRRKGQEITLSNIDKWFKQAAVFGKNISTTDTGIIFKKVAPFKRSLNLMEFNDFLELLAGTKDLTSDDLRSKLTKSGMPSISGTTRTSRVGAVDRLTSPWPNKSREDADTRSTATEGSSLPSILKSESMDLQ